MVQEQVNLKELDIKDLKALAFDLLSEKEAVQSNLNIVVGELQKRTQEEKPQD